MIFVSICMLTRVLRLRRLLHQRHSGAVLGVFAQKLDEIFERTVALVINHLVAASAH